MSHYAYRLLNSHQFSTHTHTGTWGLDLCYHEAFSDPVDGKDFYHIVQIKYNTNLGGPHKGNTKPVFTVGFKKGQLVVYKNLSSGHVPIGPIQSLANKCVRVRRWVGVMGLCALASLPLLFRSPLRV